MIIVHLADLHLGYRAYRRATPEGSNQREADVSAAAGAALDQVAELAPDLVLIAGDLFHSVRPSNAAIADAFRKLSLLSSRLPDTPIVLIGGDRDTPRGPDPVSILELFREIPGVFVATRRVERFRFEAIDTEVVAVPHAALPDVAVDLAADEAVGESVLVAHGALQEEVPDGAPGQASDGRAPIPAALLDSRRWSYVALGHQPVARQVAPNVWYSGSLERTSPDPWTEATVEKGFIRFDTATGESRLSPVPTREVIDMPSISADGRTPRQLEEAIEALVGSRLERVEGRIVRLTIHDLARDELRELERGILREARRAALHLVVDTRPPRRGGESAELLRVRGLSLEEQVEDYLGRIWEPTMPEIDTGRLVELARTYLAQSEEGTER